MALLGIVGFGLVWGWLIGGRRLTVDRWPWNVPLIGLSVTLACFQVYLFTGESIRFAVVYLGAFGLALVIHRAWLSELQTQFGSHSSHD